MLTFELHIYIRLTHSRDQDQDHAYFDCKNLGYCDMTLLEILLLPSNRKSYVGIRMACLHLTLTNSKGQCQGHTHFVCEYRANGHIDVKHSC